MTTIRKIISGATGLVALVATVVGGNANAGASSTHVRATYSVPPGYYTIAAGPHAVWVLDGDEFHNGRLYRINPVSGVMWLARRLPFPAGSLTVAFGSLWVSDYFGNTVWRLSPSGRVEAEVGVGLQPQWMHAAFGSLWVSNHHGASASRIDPTTNTVIDTVQVGAPDTFRDGPQAITSNAHHVFAGSSNLQALQKVDPETDTVTTGPSVDDAFCGPLVPAGGFIWSTDACTGAIYQLTQGGAVHQSITSTGVPGGVAKLDDQLWISDDTTFDPDTFQGSNAVLEQLNPVTGEVLHSIAIGGDATDVTSAFGDLWVWDAVASTIRRVHV